MEFDSEILGILDRIKENDSADATFDYAWTQGRRLYLAGRYFELHEVFEFQWKKETGPRKLFFHGWIQLAISLNKIFVKPNIRGARMQAEKSRQKFFSLSESGALSIAGESYNDILMEFLDLLLSFFANENSWELERIKQLSLPEFCKDGKEWFSVSLFP